MPSVKNTDAKTRVLLPKPKRGVKTSAAWEPPSVIPGVKHAVEGLEALTYTTTDRPKKPRDAEARNPDQTGYTDWRNESGGVNRANRASKEKYDNAIASYKRKQELRLSIPSLPDSEALNLESQRRASRSRMRGREGALSQRETLG